MILTITMNPAIDKTIYLKELKKGGLNRIENPILHAGGKGINVSKTIKSLGSNSKSIGFAGGNYGRMLLQLMDKEYIHHDFVWMEQETRVNTKICEEGGVTTEFNEKGPVIQEEQVERFMEKLTSYMKAPALFVISGSVPKGVPTDIYARIIRACHEKGIQVLLDAEKDLLRQGLEAAPDMIKPNRGEFLELTGLPEEASLEEIIHAGREIQKKGINTVAITLGGDGAVLLRGEKCIYSPALKVHTGSTVGAGDAFVAGLAFAWEQGFSEEETMRVCMAAASGAVTTIGSDSPRGEIIGDLMKQVVLEEKKES